MRLNFILHFQNIHYLVNNIQKPFYFVLCLKGVKKNTKNNIKYSYGSN